MRLIVLSHKPSWQSARSVSGFATDGGFPFQISALSEIFDETRVLVPVGRDGNRKGELPLTGHHLRVVPLTKRHGGGWASKLTFVPWFVRNFPVLLQELRRADVVHAPIPGDVGTVGMLGAFLLRKPLLVRHCGNWLRPKTAAEKFWRWFMETYAGGRNVMLATGGASEPPSAKNPEVKWIFSTSLTEEELSRYGQVRQAPVPGRAHLCLVARQDSAKGAGIVIDALPYLAADLPDLQFNIIGDGPGLAEFREKAERLGVADKLVFHGKLGHDAVMQALRQADVFCFPTAASDGFPKAVLEALASGLPVVATRVSVLPALLEDGSGMLLDERSPEALARAVKQILKSQSSYEEMSAKAIKTARRYSLETWRNTIKEHLAPGLKSSRLAFDDDWPSPSRGRVVSARTDSPSTTPPAQASPAILAGLRVCFLAGTLGQGGAERQLFYLLRCLKECGAAVTLLTLTEGEHWEGPIRRLGVVVQFVGASPSRFVRVARICRTVCSIRPHILQSQHFYTNAYVALSSMAARCVGIGAVRSDGLSEVRSGGPLFGRLSLRTPRILAANSMVAIRNLQMLGLSPDRFRYLPNVVDTDYFRPAKSTKNSPATILGVGRLVAVKRFDRFLHLLASLRKDQQIAAKGVIVGDGILREELQGLAQKLELLPGAVEFVGSRVELKSIYHEARVLLLTSDREGTPNVVMEAMACGLPVVATNVGGVVDLLKNGESGCLFEPGDVAGAVSSLSRLLKEPAWAMELGTQARLSIERQHSTAALPQLLAGLYAPMLSRQSQMALS